MDASTINLPSAGRRRGRYSDAFKAEIVAACKAPGISTAAVALANSLNANLVRRWVHESDPANSVVTRATSPQAPTPAGESGGQTTVSVIRRPEVATALQSGSQDARTCPDQGCERPKCSGPARGGP